LKMSNSLASPNPALSRFLQEVQNETQIQKFNEQVYQLVFYLLAKFTRQHLGTRS
jgi:hypothetical protein